MKTSLKPVSTSMANLKTSLVGNLPEFLFPLKNIGLNFPCSGCLLLVVLLLVGTTPSVSQEPKPNAISARNIIFNGVQHFNQRKIKSVLNIIDGSLISADQLDEKINSLIQLYRDEGFLSARLDSIVWPQNTAVRKTVQVFITEDNPFRIGQLFIFGNDLFSIQLIKDWFETGPGKVFHQKQLEQDIQGLLVQYREAGYLLARVDIGKLDIDADKNTVDIVLNISENRRVRLNRFEISGNQSTGEKIIVRELGLQPGEILKRNLPMRIRTKFRRLPFLTLVRDPAIKFTPDSQAVVQLVVQEQNSSQFNGVLGYNPRQASHDGYITGQIDLQFQNLLGTGRSFLAFWDKRSPDTQSLRLNYKEPWLLNRPVNGEFGFSQIVQDTSFVRRSWILGLQLFVYENIWAGLQIGQESVIPDSIGRQLYGLPRSRANRLYLEVGFDSRNHPWNPTAGLKYLTSVDFVKKKIQSSGSQTEGIPGDFRRMRLDLEYVRPLFRRQVISAGLHGRQVKIGSQPVPLDELFRVGGANSLRGYREDQFLGSQVAWASLEFRLILDRDSRIGFFFDMGYIGRRDDQSEWNQIFRTGFGFGLLTKTNLGIIGFDYGLGKGDNFSQGKIHLRLINTF